MSDQKKTKREVLASSVGLIGASLGMAAASEAAAATQVGAASRTIKLTPMHSEIAIQNASIAALESQSHSSDPRRAAIMQAALDQIRKGGGAASDFGLSFGLSWKTAGAQ
jgi:hypothetical protein